MLKDAYHHELLDQNNFVQLTKLNDVCLHTPFCNANRHMSNWIRRNAFDFVKHHASTTSAHSVQQIALTLTTAVHFRHGALDFGRGILYRLDSLNFGKKR